MHAIPSTKDIGKIRTAELEKVLGRDHTQFGFQRNLKTLQETMDIKEVIEADLGQLLAVLYLTKICDRVVRKLLVDK